MMMSSNNVSEDTPQPTISVTDGSCVLSMFWKIKEKGHRMWKSVVLMSPNLMMQSWFISWLNSVVVSCLPKLRIWNTVVKKLKTITANKVGERLWRVLQVCGVYRLWQELSADDYKSWKSPCWLALLKAHLLTGSFTVQMQSTTFS